MSSFDDAMNIMGIGKTQDTTFEDKGVWAQHKNQLVIYDEFVEIYTELLWDDSIDEFSIVRCAVLKNAGVVPKVIIRNNRRGRQPVIGPKTNDNLSYGRYELPRGKFKLLKIDGCDVTLETTAVENFTIGAYGIEEVPEIELVGDARLNCPETSGKRMMKVGPEPLQGSTKHSRSCQYIIWTTNSQVEDFLSEDMIEGRKTLARINPEMAEFVGLHTLEKRLDKAIELLAINPKLDVSKLLTHEYNIQNLTILIGCVVLDLSDECCKSHGEIYYEINRWEELAKRYDIPYDADKADMFDVVSEIVIRKKFEGKQFSELSAWDKKVVYELIPVYSLNFSGKSDEECAEEWWSKVMG